MRNTKHVLPMILVFASMVLYSVFAYTLERTDFWTLCSLYLGLFILGYGLYKTQHFSFTTLAGIALLLRLVFLFAIPNLSQDFYRFIWDGRMLAAGFNPYVSLPETFIQLGQFPIAQAKELFTGMGMLNGSHYTNYPPIHQLAFLVAGVISKHSILGAVIVVRLQLILADIGIVYFGKRILQKLNIPVKNIFLYALNPFIIIELTGNLHFEALMLFFLVWALYYILKNKCWWGAILLGVAVSVKLIPLLFIPVFYQWFVKPSSSSFARRLLIYSSFILIVLLVNVLLFLPFLSTDVIAKYSSSIGLWFQNFEFNASGYYLARELGYLFRGWNEIAIIGKVLAMLSTVFVLGLSLFRKNTKPKELISGMLFALSFYYFMSTTVHPWYLASLVLLTVFTRYRFPIVWSIVIVLSYQAYSNTPWQEHLGIVCLEYSIVLGYLFWEVFQLRKTTSSED